ncbi:MFS transporter [Caldimonas brevitalea]|uniref:MFS transporter n=1 Tax=Caldimonas brevitalea TaxID=413882 RepID=A0A0G3BH10_9BURK|nr:MFS transporter [Caldimonas brevitalea]AKJ28734.1 MFS transporter [Caldimonas brevitalea]
MPVTLRAVIAGQVCLHACMAGTRLAAPLLALEQGRSAWAVGVLLALFAVGPALLSLQAGRMADRHGYHRPVAIGVAMSLAGAVLAVALQHYAALCIAALCTGGGTSFALVAIQRTAGRTARDETELKRVFSWLALGPALSNFAGPFTAGLLIDRWGFRAAFAVLALLPLVTLAFSRRVPREAPAAAPAARVRGSTRALLRLAPLRRLLWVNWSLSTCWDVHTFVLPVLGHQRELAASVIGSILGAFSIAAVVVRLLIPLYAHRLKEWQVLYGALTLTGLVFAVYPFMRQPWSMGLCSVLLGAALGTVQPMVMSALHQVTPASRHGQALGLRMTALNVSSSAMPLLFGAIGATVGAGILFWAAGLLVATGGWQARHIRQDLSDARVTRPDGPHG